MSLAAYVVAARRAGVNTVGRIATMAPGTIPEYMVPSAFVRLDALPLTPNGKDRPPGPPRPGGHGSSAGADFVPPRGPIEEALAEIWTELLGVDRSALTTTSSSAAATRSWPFSFWLAIRRTFDVEAPLEDFH